MTYLSMVSSTVLVLLLTGAQIASAQRAPVTLGKSEGSLHTIDERTELIGATFDPKDLKLEYNLIGSKERKQERITLQEFPWPIQRDVPYRIDVEKNNDGRVVLSNPRLELLAKWQNAEGKIPSSASVTKFKGVLQKIPADALWIPPTLRWSLEDATLGAIVDMPSDKAGRQTIVEMWYLQQKSYHNNKQIPFSVFEQASQVCLATCAIRRNGRPNPHGSGVLIGKNLVLTCRHNFADGLGPSDKCHALFHFTDNDEGAIFEIKRQYYDSPALDFCLLELGAYKPTAKRPTFVLPTPPKLGVEPELEQDVGIYVSGHPDGHALSVALNCQVVYPYRLEDNGAVTKLIQLAVLRLFTSPAEYDKLRPTYEPKVTKFFNANYKLSGQSGFYFRPNDHPTIGADPDTKHGNSGGPAFDVERNAVIGILREGAPDDRDFSAGANFANFEGIIPISQIVAELDKSPTRDWKTNFGVVYFGD